MAGEGFFSAAATGIGVTLFLQDQLTLGLKTSLGRIRSFAASASTSFRGLISRVTSLRTLLATLVTGFVVRAFSRLITTTADFEDKIGKLSTRLGLSTEFLSEMAFAAERSGVNFETLSMAFQRFQRRLAEFQRGGGGPIATGLSILGLQGAASNARGLEELLPQLADRFRELGDSTTAALAAQQLFDSEGVRLVQLLKLGSAEIASLREEAQRYGLTISQVAADRAAAFNNSLINMRSALQGLLRNAITPILPPLTELITRLTDFFVTRREEIARGFEDIFGAWIEKGGALRVAIEGVGSSFRLMAQGVLAGVNGLLAAELVLAKLRLQFSRSFSATTGATGGPLRDVAGIPIDPARASAIGRAAKDSAAVLGIPVEALKALADVQSAERRVAELEARILNLDSLRQSLSTGGAGAGGAAENDPSVFQGRISTRLGNRPRPSRALASSAASSSTGSDYLAGLKSAFGQLADQVTSFRIASQTALAVTTTAADGLSDAIIAGAERTKRWGEAFKDFTASAARDISRLILRMAILQGISGIAGALGLNPAPAPAGALPQGAIGGEFNGPLSGYLAVLHGRERVVQLGQGRRVGPGDSGGAAVYVTVNNNIAAMDAASFDARWRETAQRQGRELADIVQARLHSSSAYRQGMRG